MSAYWLFLLLPLLLWPMRRSLAPLPRHARALTLGVRALLLSLLILALAGVRLPRESDELSVVFALDRSASITPEAEAAGRDWIARALAGQRRGDDATLIGFAGSAAPLPADPGAAWPAQPEREQTLFSRAIGFASALFSEGKTRRLVLLSDGYDTRGGGLAEAGTLPASGITLYTVALQNPFRPEVLVESLAVPARLRAGEPFNATATLRSNTETSATVRLYANGFRVAQEQVNLTPGSQPVRFRNLRPEKSTTTYEVEVIPGRDTLRENNKAQATALQRGEPRLLVIDPEPERMAPLREALTREGIAVEVRPAQGVPRTLAELQRYDALFLSDLSAIHLTPAQMELCVRWVRDFGGGFAMLGGEQSFGDYVNTPLAAVLPVRLEHDDRAETPSVAVMVVLDSSGSMAAQVAGQTKMALANQGAAMALDVLQKKDQLGVTAVDSRVHEVVPLSRHENREAVRQRILRVSAGGGGIYVYTALLDAFARLRDIDARVRHVILFSDAADAEEKASGEMPDGSVTPGTALDLATTMATHRITTSAVALGAASDKDVAFLKQLAANGNGRFYLTGDALSLPQIFTTETMRVAQSNLVEEPVAVVATGGKAAPVAGIDWKEAPLLLGYNVTKLKPTADLLLATERGDPLLATWRFGLGRVAAFTSDAKSRWASEWLGWPGYGQFWTQLARHLLRRGGAEGGGWHVESEPVADGRLRLQIDALTPEGAYRDRLAIDAAAVLPDGTTFTRPARQTAPGRYTVEVPVAAAGAAGTAGTTWISLTTPDSPGESHFFGHTPAWPAEFLHNGTDEAALARLAEAASGVTNPAPEAIFAPPREGTRRYRDLAGPLLIAALLLLPLDIWLRRRAWPGGGKALTL